MEVPPVQVQEHSGRHTAHRRPETNYPKVGQRALSPGKAIVGGLLFGPVGAIAGAAMGDKGKIDPRQSLNSSTRLLETMSRKCPHCGSMAVSKKY